MNSPDAWTEDLLKGPHLEMTVLATIMHAPGRGAPLAIQHLARTWSAAFVSTPEISEIAAAIRALYDDGRLADWGAVKSRLVAEANQRALEALPTLRPYTEDPDFLGQRCEELLDLVQLRNLGRIAREIQDGLGRGVVDVADFVDAIHGRISEASASKLRMETVGQLAEKNWNDFLVQRENPETLTGIPTGFPRIDAATHGLQLGKPYVIGARPSHGKTALACNMADTAASHDRPVLIFAHEMDAQDYSLRIAAARANIDYNNVLRGTLNIPTTDRFMTAVEEIKQLPIHICDDTRATPRQCQAAAHALAHTHGPGLLIVDHLQLERIPGFRGTRTDELAMISQIWLHTVKSSRHAGLLLSQLNRDAAGKAPKLCELRESGAIEQDAHGAMLLWRPGLDKEDKPANQGQLMLAKNRNGPLTAQLLHFTGYCMKFVPWDSTAHTARTRREMEDGERGAITGQRGVQEDEEEI